VSQTVASRPTPEIMLDRLCDTMRDAVQQSCLLGAGAGGGAVRQKLRDGIEQLAILRVLWNARTIAVTGLQGAGKTTFVLHLLGNSPELQALLPTGIVRDEKIGILIREHAGPGVLTGAIVSRPSDTGFSVDEVAVAAEEFKTLVCSPPAGYLLMTLRVPHFLFNDTEQGLLLTPGIEDGAGDWVPAARRTVLASRQVLFVTSPVLLSDGKTPELVEGIRREFPGCPMIPVLTHCDDPAHPPEEFGRIVELFGNDNLAAKTIAFGIYRTGDSWAATHRNRVLAQLAQSTGTPATYRRTQASKLVALLEDEGLVGTALAELASVADEAFDRLPAKHRAIDAIVGIFEKEREFARRRFAGAVDGVLSGHKGGAVHVVEQEIERRGGWEKFKTWAFGFDLKDKHYIEDVMAGAWQRQNLSVAVCRCLTSSGELGLQGLGFTGPSTAALPDAQIKLLLGYEYGKSYELSMQSEPATAMAEKDFAPALRALPHVAMVWMAGAANVAVGRPSLQGQTTSQFDTQFLAEAVKQVAGAGDAAKRTVATIVGTVVAADAVDGSATAVAASLKALGVTVTPALSLLLAGGVAIAAAAIVGASVKRQLAAQDLQAAALAAGLAHAMEEAQRKAILDEFDSRMDMVQQRLVSALRDRLGLDDKLTAAVRTRISTHDADRARSRMLMAANTLLDSADMVI
jgi:hypothetical protein